MLLSKPYAELSAACHQALNRLIDQEFGHIPIVAQTQWAVPDHTVIFYEGEEITSFYNIVLRNITLDGKLYKTGGINNVITAAAFRGRGLALQLLQQVPILLFDQLGCELGLLVCADKMLPYYERLGWYLVHCPVYIRQNSKRLRWESNTMLLSKGAQLQPREIDLNGLPW